MTDVGQPNMRIFKLAFGGESHGAVIKVHQAVTFLMQETQTSRHRPENAEEFIKQVRPRMLEWDPAVIEKTGLSSPVIQVQDRDLQGTPRAYLHTPQVYVTEYKYKHAPDNGTNKYDLYMYCPVGYDGASFEPKDARLIDTPEEQKFVQGVLFAGGWNDPFGLFGLRPRGVDLPEDYVRGADADYSGQHAQICFIAQGRSLDMLNDFDVRRVEYDGKVNLVNDEIVRIIETDLAPRIKAQIKEGDGFYVNTENTIPRDASEKTGFGVSVRHSGNIDVMKGGQPLELPDNDIFFQSRNEYATSFITPNVQNPVGRKLQGMMDQIPDVPRLSDYPELLANFTFTSGEFDALLGVNGSVPQINDIEGARILVYRADFTADTQDFCPPDSIELHTPLYLWLRQNQEDQQRAVQPPPLPEMLQQRLASVQKRLGDSATHDPPHIPLLQM